LELRHINRPIEFDLSYITRLINSDKPGQIEGLSNKYFIGQTTLHTDKSPTVKHCFANKPGLDKNVVFVAQTKPKVLLRDVRQQKLCF